MQTSRPSTNITRVDVEIHVRSSMENVGTWWGKRFIEHTYRCLFFFHSQSLPPAVSHGTSTTMQ